MTRRIIVVLLIAAHAAAGSGAATPLESARALQRRLRASGRAEARVELLRPDPLGGAVRVLSGRLALELPGRARLDFENGESLTLREDGGEWLQPGTRQLLRGGPGATSDLLRWWSVLLGGGTGFHETRVAARAFVLTPVDDAGVPQRVWLGRDGLPVRIEVDAGEGAERTLRIRSWRFTRARGRAGFVLRAPAGYEQVELP